MHCCKSQSSSIIWPLREYNLVISTIVWNVRNFLNTSGCILMHWDGQMLDWHLGCISVSHKSILMEMGWKWDRRTTASGWHPDCCEASRSCCFIQINCQQQDALSASGWYCDCPDTSEAKAEAGPCSLLLLYPTCTLACSILQFYLLQFIDSTYFHLLLFTDYNDLLLLLYLTYD